MTVTPCHSPVLPSQILYGCSHRIAGVSIKLLNPAALVILYRIINIIVPLVIVISHNHYVIMYHANVFYLEVEYMNDFEFESFIAH